MSRNIPIGNYSNYVHMEVNMFEIKENMIYDKSELIEIFGSETTLHRARHKGLKVRKPTGGRVFCLGSELAKFFNMDDEMDLGNGTCKISEKHQKKIEKTLSVIGRR
jgi:hypothetical protein